MRKELFYPIIAAVAATALSDCHNDGKRDGQQHEDDVMTVNVAYPAVDSLVLHKSYPAYLEAKHYVDIVARVNGYITAQLFDDGDWVKAGQPLFTIDSTTYREKVNEAEAQLQTAQATHEYNTRQYEAMKKALESDAVSKMDVIQAESAMKESEAAIRTAKAVLENARVMLGYCTIRAPFAGHAASPPLMDGDFVAGEASPVKLTTLYDDSGVSVYLSVEDSQLLRMKDTKSGKAVDYDHIPVQFGDSIINTYTARLVYTAPAVNKATGTIDLRLSVDNPKGELRPGMYATVMLPYAIDPRAIVIKDAAIATDQLGKYVYVVNDSNQVVYTPIKTGELYQDTLRIVSEGLSPADRYVTKALLKVRDGMHVNPVVQK